MVVIVKTKLSLRDYRANIIVNKGKNKMLYNDIISMCILLKIQCLQE